MSRLTIVLKPCVHFAAGVVAGLVISTFFGQASTDPFGCGLMQPKPGQANLSAIVPIASPASACDVYDARATHIAKYFGPERGLTDPHIPLPPPNQHLMQKWSTYLPTYERYLSKYRGRNPLRVLELGVKDGGSLNMWLDFFGQGASVVGVDINPKASRFARRPRLQIMIGDIGKATFLHSICEEHGPFDFILDDASHLVHHQRSAHKVLYDKCLAMYGTYMVEDIDTSYKKKYNGLSEASFMTYAFGLVHELNAYWSCQEVTSMTDDERCGCDAGAGRTPPHSLCLDRHEEPFYKPTLFTRTTLGIYFHDGIVVFDKRPHERVPASVYGYV